MKLIRKFNLIFFTLSFAFICNFSAAIDPVEIGTKIKNDVEINFSILENLNKNFRNEEIKIKKDIRTKIKKKENTKSKIKNDRKEKIKYDNLKENKFARIKEPKSHITNQIQILFDLKTANIDDKMSNKIKNFINKQINKEGLNFKITSYANTDKGDDISRRLSLDRAINIRSIILNEGIPARNLIVKSFGHMKNKENKVIIEFEKK